MTRYNVAIDTRLNRLMFPDGTHIRFARIAIPARAKRYRAGKALHALSEARSIRLPVDDELAAEHERYIRATTDATPLRARRLARLFAAYGVLNLAF